MYAKKQKRDPVHSKSEKPPKRLLITFNASCCEGGFDSLL